jgi:hypothetical protein
MGRGAREEIYNWHSSPPAKYHNERRSIMAAIMANLTLFVPVLLCLAFVLWNAVCLVRNYRIAQKMGIPIKILIASGDNPVVGTMICSLASIPIL